ncbi:hypothetical protein GPALN_010437 [Globodera pallida]|uniref:Nodule Cysteine-Rich (NCR) secreted peptide n=1 Tax=Globodera pallida TaxID=36090 RepID=A0A183BQS7_GLOPA|nr:hypothetical protein GPALN_010437 [Globodera pallida]
MNNIPMILLLAFIVFIYPTLSKNLPVDPAIAFASVYDDGPVPGLMQREAPPECDKYTACPCLFIDCWLNIKAFCVKGYCVP